MPDNVNVRTSYENTHLSLGIYGYRECVYSYRFSPDVDIRIDRSPELIRVEYDTPIGKVTTAHQTLTEEMKRAGISWPYTEEFAIKRPENIAVVGFIFENLELIPTYDDFAEWQQTVGDDGVAFATGPDAVSPMHFIQKFLLDPTAFFFFYNDHQKKLRKLAEILEKLFDDALKLHLESPAEAIMWGQNYDDTITYPSYFQDELMPWIKKLGEAFAANNQIFACHCDGENYGLMDLIADSGMHVADAVCPYPMTKVGIEEFYYRWHDKLTIFGGIPSNILIPAVTSKDEFEAFVDNLFKVIVPGERFILGVSDMVSAIADFERVVRIGEKVEKHGRLPLQGSAFRPISAERILQPADEKAKIPSGGEAFGEIRNDVLKGDQILIKEHIQNALDTGLDANTILKQGMLCVMDVLGERFRDGTVFIPEVLMAARALNEGLTVLEPHLVKGDDKKKGTILIGTVHGDMHDIGKNMVSMMLRAVGFEVHDLGINLPTDIFVEEVKKHSADILGISALLTTTMPEMEKVIIALEENGLKDSTRVIVGGAPVTDKFANSIRADGYAADAGAAVSLVRQLLNLSR
jgi:5-methyltetrahydrofolate--homocysteine methyltransferase